jgi:SAM-dependent methyltransferase
MRVREYDGYEAYVAHQVAKTGSGKIRRRVRRRWKRDYDRYMTDWLLPLKDLVPMSGICLGARLGCEVQVLRDMGHKAIGIDLVPSPPLVITGDFHHIPFASNHFDFAYSNSIDHVFDFLMFAGEVSRVLRPTAVVYFQVALKHLGRHESLYVESIKEITGHLALFNFTLKFDEPTANTRNGRKLRKVMWTR